MKKVFLCLIGILSIYQWVYCETPIIPYSYLEYTSDNKHVFVMIAPDKETDGLGLSPQKKIETSRIREKYSSAGLYLIDGSNQPVWTIDWFAQRTLISHDGTYLVRFNLIGSQLSDEAFTIFENGKPFCSYKISDLVETKFFLPTMSGSTDFEWRKEAHLDDKNSSLELTTLSGETYTFDLKSG